MLWAQQRVRIGLMLDLIAPVNLNNGEQSLTFSIPLLQNPMSHVSEIRIKGSDSIPDRVCPCHIYCEGRSTGRYFELESSGKCQ